MDDHEWLQRDVPAVDEVSRNLTLIFPEGTDRRAWLTNANAARAVFVMLYCAAIEGSDRWIAPKAVVEMSDQQAADADFSSRMDYLARIHTPGEKARGRAWLATNSREGIRDEALRSLVTVGAVLERSLPKSSSKGRYGLRRDFAVLFEPEISFGGAGVSDHQLAPPASVQRRAGEGADSGRSGLRHRPIAGWHERCAFTRSIGRDRCRPDRGVRSPVSSRAGGPGVHGRRRAWWAGRQRRTLPRSRIRAAIGRSVARPLHGRSRRSSAVCVRGGRRVGWSDRCRPKGLAAHVAGRGGLLPRRCVFRHRLPGSRRGGLSPDCRRDRLAERDLVRFRAGPAADRLGWPRHQKSPRGPRLALRAPGPALVTGASSGIGEAFARSLAARGYDLILAARREDRLRALAAELTADHGIRAAVVVCDLAAEVGLAACRVACDAGPAPDVAILSAGFGSLGPLADLERRRETDMVRLNCVAVVDLAAHVLPGMLARRRGAIVVIASAAAYQPIPSMVTYAATKAFDLRFAQGLASELAGTGVRALAVCPGPTHTEFGRAAGAGRIHPLMPHSSPEQVVARTWTALAAGRDRVDVGPLAVIARVGQAVPHRAVQAIAGRIHRARRRAPLPPSDRRT